MEIKFYIAILKRWAWLLIAGLIISSLLGYGISLLETPTYQASTKALVMRPSQNNSTELGYLSDQQLVQTFMQLLTTTPVVDTASQRLSFPIDRTKITVQQVRDTQVILVTVEDTEPLRAAMIANVMVEVLVEQNENLQSGRYLSIEESLNSQISQVEAQINELQLEIDQISTARVQDQTDQIQAQINTLQSQIVALESENGRLSAAPAQNASQIAENNARIAQSKSLLNVYQEIFTNLVILGKPAESSGSDYVTRLQSTLKLYQEIYLQLLTNLENVRLARLQNTPNLVQIEKAEVPFIPISPKPFVNMAIAGAIGLMLAASGVFIYEYLNDTLRTPHDVEKMLDLPVLGYISEMTNTAENKVTGLTVLDQPRSPISEAFRVLRTNLEFAATDQALQTLLVTSSRPSEGKTTVAANLAASFAQRGKRVLLVDCDLRRPAVHRIMRIPNRTGLSTLFRGEVHLDAVIRNIENGITEIGVITSGSIPANPAELLQSDRMLMILAELRNAADIIILDSPPIMLADAQVLAALVDGVILVMQPGRSKNEESRSTLAQLNRAGARVLGTVFNRIPKDNREYYGGYQYYSTEGYGAYASPTDRPIQTISTYKEPSTRPNLNPTNSHRRSNR